MKHLGITPGSVSLLALVNDRDARGRVRHRSRAVERGGSAGASARQHRDDGARARRSRALSRRDRSHAARDRRAGGGRVRAVRLPVGAHSRAQSTRGHDAARMSTPIVRSSVSSTCTSRSARSRCCTASRSRCSPERGGVHHRPLGLGQVDAATLHQRAHRRSTAARSTSAPHAVHRLRQRRRRWSRCARTCRSCSSSTTCFRTRRRCRT